VVGGSSARDNGERLELALTDATIAGVGA